MAGRGTGVREDEKARKQRTVTRRADRGIRENSLEVKNDRDSTGTETT